MDSSCNVKNWVYNGNKSLGIMPWQPSLINIHFEPILDIIRYKKIRLSRAKVWSYENAFIVRNTRDIIMKLRRTSI